MRKIFAQLAVVAVVAFTAVQGVSVMHKRFHHKRAEAEVEAESQYITSLPDSGNYEFKGCFNDNAQRTIAEFTGNVKSIDECRQRAEAKGYGVFGMQYFGQCFIGKDDSQYAKLGAGPAAQCVNPLGGTWTNLVFKRKPKDEGDYKYMGCFNDNGTRMIPEFTGVVGNIEECRKRAEAKGYGVFGLQYNGQCFIGKEGSTFDKLGRGPQAQCQNPLGGTWTNMVYKKVFRGESEWEYKGCFKDTPQRAIANYLGEVRDLQGCKDLAEAKGFNVLGLQFYSQCFGGKDSEFGKYGVATGCPAMGSAWTNQVHVKKGFTDVFKEFRADAEYHYKGCFLDNPTRMVPQFVGGITSVEQCKQKAISLKKNTFSVQNGNQCFVGDSPDYAKLGEEKNKANCGPLGGYWRNQVYSML